MEDPGKKLGQAQMLGKTALARARQIRLRRTKPWKKNRAKIPRVMRGLRIWLISEEITPGHGGLQHRLIQFVPVPQR